MRRALALGAAQCVSWGTLFYTYGLVLPAMQREIGGSTTVLSGAFSLALATSGAVGLAVGRWIDRGHERAVLYGGIGIGTLTLVSWASLSSIPALYLTMTVAGLAMAMSLYEPAFAVVDRWYPTTTEKNRALTIVTLCGAMASPIFVPLASGAIEHFGWRPMLLGAGGCLAATAFIYRPLLRHSSAARAVASTEPPPFSAALRWLGAGAFASSFGGVLLSVFLPSYLTTRGDSLADAATVIALMGLAQFPARAVMAGITTRWGVAPVFGVSLTMQAAAIAIIPATRSLVVMSLAGAVFGAGNGAATILRAVAAREFTGGHGYGATVGRLGAFALAARALAPIGGALLGSLGGSVPFWVASTALVTSAVGNARSGWIARSGRNASSRRNTLSGPNTPSGPDAPSGPDGPLGTEAPSGPTAPSGPDGPSGRPTLRAGRSPRGPE